MAYPRLGTTQTVAAGTTTAGIITTAFGAQTRSIRIASAVAVRFVISQTTTTVAATDPVLPAGQVEYLTVTPGQKIAALGDSATAILFVTELA